MMLPTMEIPMPSAANGGFGGLGVDDLNAAAVHPAQILGGGGGQSGGVSSTATSTSNTNTTSAVAAVLAAASDSGGMGQYGMGVPSSSGGGGGNNNNNNTMLSSLSQSVSGLMGDPHCLFSAAAAGAAVAAAQAAQASNQDASNSYGGGGMSSGGGGGHGVGQSSDDRPDTKEGLEELCPVCGDKVRTFFIKKMLIHSVDIKHNAISYKVVLIIDHITLACLEELVPGFLTI